MDDPSSITDLASLFADDLVDLISNTNNTDHTDNGENDTVLRFDRGAAGESDDDYILVFEGFTDDLEFTDFTLDFG